MITFGSSVEHRKDLAPQSKCIYVSREYSIPPVLYQNPHLLRNEYRYRLHNLIKTLILFVIIKKFPAYYYAAKCDCLNYGIQTLDRSRHRPSAESFSLMVASDLSPGSLAGRRPAKNPPAFSRL